MHSFPSTQRSLFSTHWESTYLLLPGRSPFSPTTKGGLLFSLWEIFPLALVGKFFLSPPPSRLLLSCHWESASLLLPHRRSSRSLLEVYNFYVCLLVCTSEWCCFCHCRKSPFLLQCVLTSILVAILRCKNGQHSLVSRK